MSKSYIQEALSSSSSAVKDITINDEVMNTLQSACSKLEIHKSFRKPAKMEEKVAKMSDTNAAGSSDSDSRPSTRSSSRDSGLATNSLKKLSQSTNKFMENFNPETSAREKRKLVRKLNTGGKKHSGAVYDESGIHMASGKDMCDCLFARCPGCFFPCPKCKSTKCGSECRGNRKYVYEQVDFEGCNITVKNTIGKP